MKNRDVNYKAQQSVRARFVLWLLETSVPLHTFLKKERIAWDLRPEDFLAYEQGSLGHALGAFYQQEKFEPVPKAERHDVFHVLFGYRTDVVDESAMQFFLWGNGKASLFTIGTCLISGCLFPNKLGYFIKHYKKGKQTVSIKDWNFRWLLSENTENLKHQIFNLK
jgi:hypothetical protein